MKDEGFEIGDEGTMTREVRIANRVGWVPGSRRSFCGRRRPDWVSPRRIACSEQVKRRTRLRRVGNTRSATRRLGTGRRRRSSFAAECGYRGVEIAPFTLDRMCGRFRRGDGSSANRPARPASKWSACTGCCQDRGFSFDQPRRSGATQTAQYLGELARFGDLGGRVMVFGSPPQRNLPPGVSL